MPRAGGSGHWPTHIHGEVAQLGRWLFFKLQVSLFLPWPIMLLLFMQPTGFVVVVFFHTNTDHIGPSRMLSTLQRMWFVYWRLYYQAMKNWKCVAHTVVWSTKVALLRCLWPGLFVHWGGGGGGYTALGGWLTVQIHPHSEASCWPFNFFLYSHSAVKQDISAN